MTIKSINQHSKAWLQPRKLGTTKGNELNEFPDRNFGSVRAFPEYWCSLTGVCVHSQGQERPWPLKKLFPRTQVSVGHWHTATPTPNLSLSLLLG